jgi:hypothetical protein
MAGWPSLESSVIDYGIGNSLNQTGGASQVRQDLTTRDAHGWQVVPPFQLKSLQLGDVHHDGAPARRRQALSNPCSFVREMTYDCSKAADGGGTADPLMDGQIHKAPTLEVFRNAERPLEDAKYLEGFERLGPGVVRIWERG